LSRITVSKFFILDPLAYLFCKKNPPWTGETAGERLGAVRPSLISIIQSHGIGGGKERGNDGEVNEEKLG